MKENNQTREKISNIFHNNIIMQYFIIGIATIAVTSFLFLVVLFHAYIPSESMEGTLNIGDRLIGNRLAYKFGDTPERFDIVIFNAPDDGEIYIKRVIGLPGEKVTIKNGKVYINDSTAPLDDSFIKEEMEYEETMTFNVPEGCYFMMGDNRNESWDSRYWDNPYVEESEILAKAVFKYWKGFEIL